MRAHGEHQALLAIIAEAQHHCRGCARRLAQEIGHLGVVPTWTYRRRIERKQRARQ
jgi:hypothetical protein